MLLATRLKYSWAVRNRSTRSIVLFNGCIGDWFRTTVWVRQGCLLSSTLFNIFWKGSWQTPLKIPNALSVLEAERSPVSSLLMTSMTSRRGRRTSKISWASRQSLSCLLHGDRCREDQADAKHQRHQQRDQSKRTEAWDSHKLQVPGLSCIWRGLQAWNALQDSTAQDSSINKVETSFEWQEYFSQLQDTTDALPCYCHLHLCLPIIDPHSRAAKKNVEPWKWRNTAKYYASHTKTT